jgi:hypothetical protein
MRVGLTLCSSLFLLAAGLDVGAAVYNRYEMDKMTFEPRPELPKPLPSENPYDSLMHPDLFVPPVLFEESTRTKRPWEEVARDLKSVRVDPEKYRQPYLLEIAKRKQAAKAESQLVYLVENGLPVVSAFNSVSSSERYLSAVVRFDAGTASPEDIDAIARFEWQNEIKR